MFAKLVGPDVLAESNTRNAPPYRSYMAAVVAIMFGLLIFTSDARAGTPGIRSDSTSVQLTEVNQVGETQLPTGGSCWTVMPTNISADLSGVAVISPDDIWAVGTGRTIHWNGTQWSDIPSPGGGGTSDVGAISTNDVWAVGYYSDGPRNRTRIKHWDGNIWSVVPSPNVGAGWNVLNGVTAISTNDVWAVGYYTDESSVDRTLILHWDGNIWSVVPSPNANGSHNELRGVTAIATNDVWAVGCSGGCDSGADTLTMHWDGTQWTVVPSPVAPSSENLLEDVTAISTNDVWAVGGRGPMAIHWNGTQWSLVPVPSPPGGVNKSLWDVAAVSANDVWAVGTYMAGSGQPSQTLVWHFDGTQWSIVPSPNPGSGSDWFRAVAAWGTSIWAVGTSFYASTSEALVARHDPCGSTTPTATQTSMPPTSTRTPTSTETSVPPTGTSVPPTVTQVSTSTSVPPTSTVQPPTSTAIAPTGTSVPPTVTQVGTSTSIPPTSTAQPPTSTLVPPTATREPCTLTFTDVPSSNTFYANVRCLACRGIISGYADGTFKPNNQVTRGQLAKIVSNAAGFIEEPNPQIFEDVPLADTFYQWINRLARRGHMSGYACGGVGEPCTTGRPYFRPFANATRGQTSKIVSNAAGYSEIPTDQTFEDVPATHTFYMEIQRLASRNIMQGYSCGGVGEPCLSGKPYFRPANNVTRGQSAKIVANTFYPGCDTP